MRNSGPATTLHFSPLLDDIWLISLGGLGLALLMISVVKFRRVAFWRGLTLLLFMLTLMGPSLLKEERVAARDTAIIVVDESQSQQAGKRMQRTHRALESLQKRLENEPGLDIQIIKAPKAASLENQTILFRELDLALSGIPAQRRAGVILITDGQIHDIPENESLYAGYGPVHALLSGEKNEKDRQIVITNAPAYGLVGQNITVRYRVEDTKNISTKTADITLTNHGGVQEQATVETSAENIITLPINNSGQNVFTLSTPPLNGEITKANNTTALIVNGVRDRLKVLLVSGHPHAGGRTWRDLLTSDPGVDLIHFTILREPDKIDFTPQREMSLIPFPFRELFEVKLYDFDLIIFDRYHQNNILPGFYYENIVRYVEKGGAFLEASGPSFAGKKSIYTTPLKAIIPGVPTGKTEETPFTPSLTELGKKHPVTASLIWKQNISPENPYGWGDWLRQVEIKPKAGDVLMNGTQNMPLLVLNRLKEGRVAQIASDHIWLWSRGYDGGGPHAELLRRVVHWLMKEPELDEQALDIRVDKNTIHVRKQAYMQELESIAMTKPDGESVTLKLTPDETGWLQTKIEADALGIHAFEDTKGTRKFAVIGDLNPPELRDMRTSAKKLASLIKTAKGGALWLEDTPEPRTKMLSGTRSFAGKDWIGLRRNNDYTIAGVKDIPLFPAWLSLIMLLFLITYTWWKEGQRKK